MRGFTIGYVRLRPIPKRTRQQIEDCIEAYTDIKYRKIRRRLAALSMLLLSACAEREPPPLTGYLYFGAGSYLGQLSLSTGDAEPVTRLGDLRIDHVSAFDNNELLLSIEDDSNVRTHWRILRYKPSSNTTSELFNGRGAHYLAESETIVFDDSQHLLAAARRNYRREQYVIQAHARQETPMVIDINGRAILFQESEEAAVIHRYDIASGQAEPLPELSQRCRLAGAVWINDRMRLLCRSLANANQDVRYQLVSTTGRVDGELALPHSSHFWVVTYLEDQHTIILSETRRNWFTRRPEHPVWAYDLETAELRRIADDQYLGESVVYRRW